MKRGKQRVLTLGAILLICLLSGCAREQPEPNERTITIEVNHSDGTAKSVTVTTEEAYLGPVLLTCEELGVSGETAAYGLYIQTVDGETASDENHTYWCIARNGEETATGADATPLEDGDTFTLSLVSWEA